MKVQYMMVRLDRGEKVEGHDRGGEVTIYKIGIVKDLRPTPAKIF